MQEEALCGSGGAGCGTGSGGENFWNVFDCEASAANVEHGADQVADHVVEEAAAANAVDEEIAGFGFLLLPGGGKNGADSGLGEEQGICRWWRGAGRKLIVGWMA
jgi:hypothetical protein